jgi:hypothetical protein
LAAARKPSLEIVPRAAYYKQMSFFRDVSLRNAGADLIGFLRTQNRHSLPLLLAACVPTAIIIYTFYLDTLEKAKPPPPSVTYFESWPATRTIEESKAAIAERQKLKDKMLLREKEAYKAFGRAVGMDVEKIEREAAAERAKAAGAASGASK